LIVEAGGGKTNAGDGKAYAGKARENCIRHRIDA
jgi:hypothetical protein